MATEWIADGEKYALIGLEVKVDQAVPFREFEPGLWVWTDQKFDVPAHWREWIGSIRADQVENCNLALLCKIPSQTPDILDSENQLLQRRAWGFYVGLLLSSTFTPSHEPIILTGARRDGEIDVRQESSLDIPSLNVFRHYPPIFSQEIEHAAVLGRCHETLNATPVPGGAWRIFRALSVYVAARTSMQLLDRLHQYCRCIDGLILSEPGKGAAQFKSRTELFVGPSHHPLMGDLYAIRSHVEHLHEYKYLGNFDREERLDLVRKEAIVEHIARNALAHILLNAGLWPYFGNDGALRHLETFHSRAAVDLGKSLDQPADALVAYDSDQITDFDLGAG